MIEIIDCDQNSPEWYAARAGVPTSSMFTAILAKGQGGDPSKSRRTYMNKLAGEILTGTPADNYSNAHMARGHELEAEASDFYAFMNDVEPQHVGFIRNGFVGCSPDRLIGDAGLVELKTKVPHLLIDAIRKDKFPPEHKAQCQGQLWISERDWVDLVIYWPSPGLPYFVQRAVRDEDYIKVLKDAVTKFNDELQEVVEQVRRYGQPPGQVAAQ